MKKFGAFLWRWTKRLVALSLVLGLVGAGVLAWLYKKHVVDDPGPHIARQHIMGVITQESPVLYGDGQTRIGVFFAQEHRDYVTYDRIPQAWVDAITSAEDQRFFEHPGIDPKGIARAMLSNLQAGHVVAGGSTLTQQTAKNIYYRPDRSVRSKWEELVNALRLEAHFSKQDILEFYANQFHVSANGRGLGIAARYFFDKEVEDLTVQECAYIAGMVKAPATYNPFIGVSEERRQGARDKAQVRTAYVLDRMLEEGKIDKATHDKLVDQPIPFKRGTFRYDTSVLLDEVAARLEQPPFDKVFADLGIDNPSTAGIQVVTTLHADAQREATYALWHHLSEIGPVLEGQEARAFTLDPAKAPTENPNDVPVRHEFRTATVTKSAAEGIELDLGGHPCTVDAAGLERAGTIVAQARSGNRYVEGKDSDRAEVVKAAAKGKVVWASLREEGVCDLEIRPELQGAVLLLEQGAIRAMVGGNDNRNFNRATAARRQLGSTWKPLVFFSALQLGWAPTDPLDNRRNVFTFEGTWYYPRPDHESVDWSSMSWAGTRSENLASIWLLYHLTDRLTDEQLQDVAALVGLTPQKGESKPDWIVRLRDKLGVIATEDRFEEVAYLAARQELVLGGLDVHPEDADAMLSLSFGWGAKKEAGRQSGIKRQAVNRNHRQLLALGEECASQVAKLRISAETGTVLTTKQVDELSFRPGTKGRFEVACGTPPALPEGDMAWTPLGDYLLAAIADGVEVPLEADDHILVDGSLHLSTLRTLENARERHLAMLQGQDPYDLATLIHHPDFRQLINMRYVAGLANRLGVQGEIPPVLSMPLGATEISLVEAAGIYQGMLDGQTWTFPGKLFVEGEVPGLRISHAVDSPQAATQLIAEIRDRYGNVLYRARPAPEPVADPIAGRLVGDILRNVVKWGTGKRALDSARVGRATVPVAGKTGTTNSYKNAAFMGFVPTSDGQGWAWGRGYTLGVYVGYDDNRPMSRGKSRLAGASGALPAWVQTVKGLAEIGLLGRTASEAEWAIDQGFEQAFVVDGSGLVDELASEGERRVLVHGTVDEPRRLYSPFLSSEPLPPPPAPESAAQGEVEEPAVPDEQPIPEGPVDTGEGVPEEAPPFVPPPTPAEPADTP